MKTLLTHTYAVLRSNQTADRNHDVCANVLKLGYMQQSCLSFAYNKLMTQR